jgi:hypothetical protein
MYNMKIASFFFFFLFKDIYTLGITWKPQIMQNLMKSQVNKKYPLKIFASKKLNKYNLKNKIKSYFIIIIIYISFMNLMLFFMHQ